MFAFKILAISLLFGWGTLVGAFAAYTALEICQSLGWIDLPWGKRQVNISNVFFISERTPEAVEKVKREVVEKLKEASVK